MNAETGVRDRARYGIRRLALATVTALVVLVIALSAAWEQANGNYYVRAEVVQTQLQIQRIGKLIETHRKTHGKLPPDLRTLRPLADGSLGSNGTAHDGWNRPLHYEPRGDTYLLHSFGRDGKSGGRGFDSDFSNLDLSPRGSGLPEWEFLVHPLARGMVATCFLAAAVAFGLVFLITAPGDFSRSGVWAIGGKLLATALATLIMAGVLMVLHIPSGH